MIKNTDIANVLHEIGLLLEMGEQKDPNITFRVRSYIRAHNIITSLSYSVEEEYRKSGLKGLMEIPSIGKAMASKIEEYLKTGKIQYLEDLRSKTPVKINEFYGLQGVGPKTIKILYDYLGVKDLSDLEKAASQGKLRNIPGFSQKKEEAILKKIGLKKKREGYLLGEIYPMVKQIEIRLSKVKGVRNAVAAGSFRRMKETIGDIDFVVASNQVERVTDYFVSMQEIAEVLSRGPTKTFVRLNNGMDADLLVVPEKSFGAALQYFTGSKEHGVAIRKIALAKDLHLNEWGVFDNWQNRVAGSNEEDVYRALDLKWIPPEMRENRGEIELAKKGGSGLPDLIQYSDLKGDVQVHSNYTDGTMSIADMASAANEKFGLQYIAITDHTKSLKFTNGLDEDRLLEQTNKIAEVNDNIRQGKTVRQQFARSKKDRTHLARWNNFRVLSGAEVNIMKDGSLDITNNVLDKLDVVGAAIHSNFSLPIEVQTDRLTKAAQNPSVDIIFHPTGRRINEREGYPVDIPKLMEVARDTNTALEVDAQYDRLDLKDEDIRVAVQKNVKIVINSDAHHPVHYSYLELGVAQARRGWAKKSDVLDTLSVDNFLKNLK
jgi:DNA polymerase (family 10)